MEKTHEPIPDIVHESWHSYLQPLFDNNKMLIMKNEILPNYKFYPESKDVFRVFSTPLDKIKVVILGQDPYPKVGEANGLAFAVHKGIPIPKSLNIVKNEILNSRVERDSHTNIESDRWRELLHWKAQGVFLLNVALTVESRNSGSHINMWQWFASEIVRVIAREVHPIWLLWGARAKGYKTIIRSAGEPTDILEADHPAAETYPNSKYKFSGCNHFVLCNRRLKDNGQSIINW